MSGSTSTEIAQINEVMRSDRGRYDSDPAMQSRLRDLYDAQEAGTRPAPKAAVKELTDIQRIMRTDMQRYWRDEEMQERYRELLGAEETDASHDVVVSKAEASWPIHLPTPSEWQKAGGDPAQYSRQNTLIREVNDVLRDVPEEGRAQFDASFSQLPPSIRSVALGALLDKRAVPIDPLSDAAIAELRRIPSYAALIREWGYEAPSKLAAAKERLWRIMDRLNDYEVRAATSWLDRLPTSATIALMRKLAR